ncbi:MAG TPA: ATP-binding protein [Patescibacteria group bacterium]
MNFFSWLNNRSIKLKIGIIAGTLGVLLIALLYSLGVYSQRQFLMQDINESNKENKAVFDIALSREKQLLSAATELLGQNKEIKNAYISGDRDYLYTVVLPYYNSLVKNYNIQSVTFVKPTQEIFLRMQRRNIYGDTPAKLSVIERAQASGKIEVGLEESTHQLALWAVLPYKDTSGNIIGYLVLGENVNKFFSNLSSETGNLFGVFIKKNILDKAAIDSATDENSKIIQGNWNLLDNYVLMDKIFATSQLTRNCFTDVHIENINNAKNINEDIVYDHKTYACIGFPFYNDKNEILGTVLYLENITEQLMFSGNIGYMMIINLGALSIIVILIMSFAVDRIVTTRIKKAKQIMESITSGNLNMRVPVGAQDEIGKTFVAFNNMTEKIAELNLTKDEFLSVAAHQLRTPLGSIRWNLEMLINEDFGKVPPKVKEVFNQIYHSNLRMINLVNDLLDVSRIDQKRMKINPQPIDIIASAKQALKEFENDIKKKSINAVLKVENKIPLLTLDAVHFHEVCENLLSNAIKYNKQNGSVTITMTKKDEYVHIVLHDTGIGIPEKEQHKMFSKFFRASNAILVDTEGTGLGLFVVKSYVEGCGGNISFTSKEGQGTTFTIRIPVVTKFEKEKNKKI